MFSFLFFASFGQFTLKGQIIDTLSGQKLEFVSVRLFSVKDSSVITGSLTDSNGNFSIDNIKANRFFMKCSFVGYETKTIRNLKFESAKPSELILGKISLRPSVVLEIGEIEVVGKLDVLKAGIDKKIYNVGDDLNSQGGSASDVLNNVPSVEVDQDGNISLRGDGNVIILVDGRPSTLTINGGLSGLPANSIERIEVVTNPSAKYDPDGTSGIINIVLKKAQLRGVNGVVASTLGTGNSFNGTATVNVRTNKINVFANYAYKYNEGYRNFDSKLTRASLLGTTLLDQNRPGKQNTDGHNLRIGMDYYITDKQTIGFSINGATSKENRYSTLTNDFYDVNSLVTSSWNRSSIDKNDNQNLDLNLNYSHVLKKNRGELSANFTSSFGNEMSTGLYENEYVIDYYALSTRPNLIQSLDKKENNSVHTGQLDYIKTLEKQKARIETGVKGIFRDQSLNTTSQTYNDSLFAYFPDTLANFRYNYKEEILSAYAIWGQVLGKFKYQLGVRGEYAQQIPYLVDSDTKIVNDYFNLFPSGHLKYDLQKKREVSLSYSKRINRANSGQLNPFTNYSDPLNLRQGNPYLNPEYINSLDLGYSVEKNKLVFTTSVFYRYTTDVIQRVKVFYSDNVTATTFGNIDQSQSYGFEAVINYKPLKWWKNTIALNGDHIQYFNASGDGNFNNSGYNLAVKYTGNVEFWKKTANFQVNVRYNTPRITSQGKVLPRSAMDISGDKRFNEHWSVGFRLSDVFNTQGFRYDFQQPDIRQQGQYKWLTRRFYITITYKFGKLEVGKKAGREGENGGGGGFDF